MKKLLYVTCLMFFASSLARAAEPAGKVLILHDEIPQMKVLAKRLETEGYKVDIVSTKEKLPPLNGYRAVVVFIHGLFPKEQAEAVIRYTRAGGRMIALHHSISSKKRKTPIWLEFLGIKLPQPQGKPLEGGYTWQHGVDLRLVNLAPGHYITTNNIRYPEKVEYKRSDVNEKPKPRQCVTFPDSEVFLNHTFTDDKAKTILYGLVAKHPKLGEKSWMQDRAGWLKKAGEGWIFYFMPGHTVADLENPVYQQVILNCLSWSPSPK